MNSITRSYREQAVRSAGQVQLVVMLYEMFIDDLRRITRAAQQNNIELRVSETQHAFAVLDQLQGTVQMKEGCETAKAFDDLYNIARAKLLDAQFKDLVDTLGRLIAMFSDLRDAWIKSSPLPQGASAKPATGEAESHCWRA